MLYNVSWKAGDYNTFRATTLFNPETMVTKWNKLSGSLRPFWVHPWSPKVPRASGNVKPISSSTVHAMFAHG
jgi:hypothetical protein